MRLRIILPKIRGKTDSFFYEGVVAYAYHNGRRFQLMACGDITIIIGNGRYAERFTNRHDSDSLDDAIRKYKLTDKKLAELDKTGRIRWENNNWFECAPLVKHPDGRWYYEDQEVFGDNISYSYDEAIQMLKDMARGD